MATAIEQSLCTDHDLEALRQRAKDFSVEKIADEYLAYMMNKND
jgi:hypothetical protein